ncbi:hypothetical protein C8F04DRAFT_1111821 [Mycena alexandri]|uniref:DUF6697 domain-containing protein n=1 Tax=Mycena alexandri TaxID=1745969 RepID=A0AAD6X1B7_9AGAR|nr:hypothetical protein C8F04DRAFT_1111821 [Mycena alexandri]
MKPLDQKLEESVLNLHHEDDKDSEPQCNSTAVEVAPLSMKKDDASIYPKVENPERLTEPFKLEESKEGVKIEVTECAAESVEAPGFKLEVKEEKPATGKLEFTPSASESGPPRGITVSRNDNKARLSESCSSSVDSPEDLGGGAQASETSSLDHTDDVRATPADAEGPMSSNPAAVAVSENAQEETRVEAPDSGDFPSSQTDATTSAPQIIVKEEPMDIDIEPGPMTHETPRPSKRRKLVMDGVEAPFIASIRNHANQQREARREGEREMERRAIDVKNLEQHRNPKVKKPKDTPTLGLDSIRARLVAQNISSEPYPIDLEKDILDVTVRRDFMSKEYGGNSQDAYPSIGAAFVEKTGKDDFAYLNLIYNPHCPEVPGAPGLRFDVGYDFALELSDDEEGDKDEEDVNSDNDDGESQRGNNVPQSANHDEDSETKDEKKKVETSTILFARLDKNMWQYQGQYVTKTAPPLTIAEWRQQAPKVRNIWTKNIANPKKDWGGWIRIGIALRRQLGRRPTEAEMVVAHKTDANFPVTQEEIGAAINRGEVFIGTSTMECIGYDVAFQRDLAAKIPFFVPAPKKPRVQKPKPKAKKATTGAKGKPAAPKAKATARASPAKREAAPASRGRKRKWAEPESESEEDEEDEEDEEEYRPQGTRSRPIRVA